MYLKAGQNETAPNFSPGVVHMNDVSSARRRSSSARWPSSFRFRARIQERFAAGTPRRSGNATWVALE